MFYVVATPATITALTEPLYREHTLTAAKAAAEQHKATTGENVVVIQVSLVWATQTLDEVA